MGCVGAGLTHGGGKQAVENPAVAHLFEVLADLLDIQGRTRSGCAPAALPPALYASSLRGAG